jgi:citrate lyase subunit beta/citryl-CoA lyase
MAAGANHIAPPIDAATLNLGDPATLAADCRHGLAMGFSGKLCIHPNQVETVNDAFSPSAGDVSWAWKVTEAAGAGGVAVVDGRMVDKPVVDRARRILQRIGNG